MSDREEKHAADAAAAVLEDWGAEATHFSRMEREVLDDVWEVDVGLEEDPGKRCIGADVVVNGGPIQYLRDYNIDRTANTIVFASGVLEIGDKLLLFLRHR